MLRQLEQPDDRRRRERRAERERRDAELAGALGSIDERARRAAKRLEQEPQPPADDEPPALRERAQDEPEPTQAKASATGLNINEADFDDLRATGMSVTQAKRVLRERERRGGFTDLDQLDSVPGFPRRFLDQLKQRLSL